MVSDFSARWSLESSLSRSVGTKQNPDARFLSLSLSFSLLLFAARTFESRVASRAREHAGRKRARFNWRDWLEADWRLSSTPARSTGRTRLPVIRFVTLHFQCGGGGVDGGRALARCARSRITGSPRARARENRRSARMRAHCFSLSLSVCVTGLSKRSLHWWTMLAAARMRNNRGGAHRVTAQRRK